MVEIEKLAELYDARIDRWIAGKQPDKSEIRTQIVLLRYMIRRNLALVNEARGNLRYYERQRKRLNQLRATVPFLDLEIMKYEGLSKAFNSTLRTFGQSLFQLLDAWQEAGAARGDLLNLCNAHRLADWAKQSLAEDRSSNFSELVFVHNLDYPNNGKDFMEDDVDAPFTHAAKEYMLDVMLNTEKGRKASRDAMTAVFPGIMEQTMIVRENEFGEKCLYDSEGNLVSTLEPKGGSGHE